MWSSFVKLKEHVHKHIRSTDKLGNSETQSRSITITLDNVKCQDGFYVALLLDEFKKYFLMCSPCSALMSLSLFIETLVSLFFGISSVIHFEEIAPSQHLRKIYSEDEDQLLSKKKDNKKSSKKMDTLEYKCQDNNNNSGSSTDGKFTMNLKQACNVVLQ